MTLTGHIRARTEENLAFRIDGRMIAAPCGSWAGGTAERPDRRTRPPTAAGRLARSAGQTCRRGGDSPRSHQQPGAQADSDGPGLVHQGRVRCRGENRSRPPRRRSMSPRRNFIRPRTNSATPNWGRCRGCRVSKGAEAGEVVRAGQTIVTVAQHDGIDAVFDVPDNLMRRLPGRDRHRRTDRRSATSRRPGKCGRPHRRQIRRPEASGSRSGSMNRPNPCGWARPSSGRRALGARGSNFRPLR